MEVASETLDQRSVPVSRIADRPCLGKRNQKVTKSQSENQHDLKIMIQILFSNVERRIWERHLVRATSTDGFSLSVLCITCGYVNQRGCDHENNWPQRCMYHRMDLFPRIETIAL